MKFGTCILSRALGALLLIVFSRLAVGAQVAAVPPLMSFQGRLTHPDGTPVADGAYRLHFSLWTAATGGTKAWKQTVDAIPVRNGAFATLLSGFTSPTFQSNLWLEIQIGTDAPLTPRQPLVSVAYAMKADSVRDRAITSASIADGTITADDFAPGVFNPLAWLLGGNSGVTNGFLGTTDNNPLELRVNNYRAMRYQYVENTLSRIRSINTLGGSSINEIAPGVLGGTIAGGGRENFSGIQSPNRVLLHFGTVSGGCGNTAAESYATVGGGHSNEADGYAATIVGGQENRTAGHYATVAGGYGNRATGDRSFVAGGVVNTAAGAYSFAAGNRANAKHSGAFVWAGGQENEFASTGVNQFLIRASGGVGINTNNPGGYALRVNGSVGGVGAYSNVSDVRYKTNIAPLENPLETLVSLRGVTFDWKKEEFPEMRFAQGRQIGFIAQEVERVLPELVTTDREGYKSVAYSSLVPVLVEALKQQQKRLESQQAQIETLTRRLDALQPHR